MTRGNQRDIDRQRAANRHAKTGESKEGDPRKRMVSPHTLYIYMPVIVIVTCNNDLHYVLLLK